MIAINITYNTVANETKTTIMLLWGLYLKYAEWDKSK